jgi:hypothetical protein
MSIVPQAEEALEWFSCFMLQNLRITSFISRACGLSCTLHHLNSDRPLWTDDDILLDGEKKIVVPGGLL